MTKAQIAERVRERAVGLSAKEAVDAVDCVFGALKEAAERGQVVKIAGFGHFVVRDKKARAGRNPQTGQEIAISARRVLRFKPSQLLKSALNGGS